MTDDERLAEIRERFAHARAHRDYLAEWPRNMLSIQESNIIVYADDVEFLFALITQENQHEAH